MRVLGSQFRLGRHCSVWCLVSNIPKPRQSISNDPVVAMWARLDRPMRGVPELQNGLGNWTRYALISNIAGEFRESDSSFE